MTFSFAPVDNSSNKNKLVVIAPTINDIPAIPESITGSQILQYFSFTQYSDIVTAKITSQGGLLLHFHKSDNPDNADVELDESFFDPNSWNAFYPKFLFQISTMSNAPVDYFNNKQHQLIFNHNQIMWFILATRLQSFISVDERFNHFVGLVRKDIAVLKTYCEFSIPRTYNGIQKAKNQYVLLNPWDPKSNINNLMLQKDHASKEKPFGEILKSNFITETQYSRILQDLPLHPSSESAFHKGKIVLAPYSDGQLYRSVGYAEWNNHGNMGIVSIFPPKQNMPARLKTHLIADAYPVVNSNIAIFEQDLILKDGSWVVRDNTLFDALVLFHPMEYESGRFICGELEVSDRIANAKVRVTEIVKEQFDKLYIKEGDVLRPIDGKITIGETITGKKYHIDNAIAVVVEKISVPTFNKGYKIVLRITRFAGDSRITSNTGLKGFTKSKPNVGHIITADNVKHNVDIVAGMNSVKGKMNTIMLARAAAALKFGYYKTDNNLLNSWNEQQINDAANAFPAVKYVDEFGNEQILYAGIIQINFTELAYTYAKVKPQSFAFEAGKHIFTSSDKRLSDYIWKNYIDPDMSAIAYELYKILNDHTGAYAIEDALPVYDIRTVGKVFTVNDLLLKVETPFQHCSALLNEETNKGFYIDCTSIGGKKYRMPSAKLLNTLSGKLPNGNYIYPVIFTNMSQILKIAINNYQNNNKNYSAIYSRNFNYHRIGYYLTEAKSLLFSTDEKAQNIVQSLIKPKIPGINMKQMVDTRIPPNTVVILDRKIYDQLHKAVYTTEECFSVEDILKDELYGLAIRNPMLWCSQIQKVRIWSRDQFAEHLYHEHGIHLDNYLNCNFVQKTILVSVHDAIMQHSDVDGDLLPLFVITGDEGQQILKDWSNTNILPQELKWTEEFRDGEFGANKDLYDAPHYKLHFTLFHATADKKNKFYSKFLLNAAIAKGNIGSATNDIWALYALLQCYQAAWAECNGVFIMPDNTTVVLPELSFEEMNIMSYIFTRLVEEKVINAIKHVENGSKDFDKFYLRNMNKDDNPSIIYNALIQEFDMDHVLARNMISIICIFGLQLEWLDAVKAFITLHNKGTPVRPKSVENYDNKKDFIASNTYFGGLVNGLFEMSKVLNKPVQAMSFDFGSIGASSSQLTDNSNAVVLPQIMNFNF